MTDDNDTDAGDRQERWQASEMLRKWRDDTPSYMGDAPKAQFYQRQRRLLEVALAALRPEPPAPDLVERMPLLSFGGAQRAGEAMWDRWAEMAESGVAASGPDMDRSDAAWADLFRHGYEAIRALPLTDRGEEPADQDAWMSGWEPEGGERSR
jgi:hypothetical protein